MAFWWRGVEARVVVRNGMDGRFRKRCSTERRPQITIHLIAWAGMQYANVQIVLG
jgi:hypothetical protein